jgi:hypothetical protein
MEKDLNISCLKAGISLVVSKPRKGVWLLVLMILSLVRP